MSEQNKIIRNIPNFITILNLLAGCVSVLWSFYDLQVAALFIFAAAIFDFGDGLAARILRAYSNVGKELDSLADIVSFGVAPAMIMHQLLKISLIFGNSSFSFETANWWQLLIVLSPFLLVVFSAIRLARFNVDIRQEDHFLGLPTPASGILIASLSFILHTSDIHLKNSIILSTPLLVGLVLFLCFMMVSSLPMFTLKFRNLKFSENMLRYIFLSIAVVLFAVVKLWALPALILVYIILSILNTLIFKFN